MRIETKKLSSLPTAGVVAVAVIVIIETIFLNVTEPLTGLPYLQPTADDAVIAAKRTLFDQVEDKVVIVGDSSSMFGLMPSEMGTNDEFHFLNLGTLASLTSLGYCELAIQILNGEQKPSAIVLSVLPQTLEIDQQRAKEMGQLGRFLAAYGSSNPKLYSVSVKEVINWFVRKHRFNVFPPEFGGSFQAFQKKLQDQGGYYEEKSNRISHYRIHNEFVPSELSLGAIQMLVEEAKKHDVPVLLLLNPKPKSLITGNYLTDISEFINSLKTLYPSLKVVKNHHLILDDKYFSTETHLNKEGALQYSVEISTMIGSALSSGN